MLTRENYSRSRFSPNCEPMLPTRNYYCNLSRKDSVTTRIVVRDAYQETYDVCHEIFKEIQDKYSKCCSSNEKPDGYIKAIERGLAQMEKKAKIMGIDVTGNKKIAEGENKAEIKIQILDEINEVKNLIAILERS